MIILSLPFVSHKIILRKNGIASNIIWLFQLSAIAGISLGFEDWFISKTSLNLMLQLALFIWIFPINKFKHALLFFGLFVLGMAIEIIGISTGFPFGEYAYGNLLGPKMAGVPLLIGFNWALLILVTSIIANSLSKLFMVRILIGAVLMLLLDIHMEMVAPEFSFWAFKGIAPLQNYLSWFIFSTGLHGLVQFVRIDGDLPFSCHLYLAQLVFFAYFVLFNL